MPPKIKFTREEILSAAMDLTRERGFDGVTARDLGARLGTSAKPVYRAFASMNELKQAVVAEAWRLYDQYCDRETAQGRYPPYKAMGMAYIRFAREERELFRLLFMRDRTGEPAGAEENSYLAGVALVQAQTGKTEAQASLFHAEMWIFVHGIATMLATSYQQWDDELISRMLTDAFEGLRERG